MKTLIVIVILVILWYAFGRKWHFMRNCSRSPERLPLVDSASQIDCEEMYNSFASSPSVNWSPIAFY